ncbi:MAG TPA: hypothetical protein VGC24_05090 [Burkholderiaceae bacterium]
MNQHNPAAPWVQHACALALATSAATASAAAGAPLPRCTVGSQSFYLARYAETSATTPPKIALDQITLDPVTGAATATSIWDAQGAPLPAPEDTSLLAGATVAMGMHPTNGYIYAIRAVGNDPAWPGPWQEVRSRIQVLKYGAGGVDNLGAIQGMPADALSQLGPNYNAADFDPATGDLVIANFQTGGSLAKMYRISVAGDVPTYLSTISLSTAIPGAQSGDFAIDATGAYAYGIAKASGTLGTSMSYRVNLGTGAVESLAAPAGFLDTISPYGGGARLQDGQMAFYVAGTGAIRLLAAPAGTLSGTASTATATSADAASCLPVLPPPTTSANPVPTLSGWGLAVLALWAGIWGGRRLGGRQGNSRR